MPDKKLENFVDELTKTEIADLATYALAQLPDELAIETVTEWAASADVIEALETALDEAKGEEGEDEEEEEDEDEPV